MTFNITDAPDPDKRYCILCRRKNPPVETVLILGVNIIESRWLSKTNYCNDCYKEKQKHYNKTNRIRNPKVERIKVEEQLVKFEEEWNDKEFKNTKESADKLVNVLSKYGRRNPERGLYKLVMCEVMFPELWYVSINIVVEDLLKSRNEHPAVKNRHRDTLYLYIPSVMDAFQTYYRRKAINKFDGLVTAINHKYHGKERFCAKPSYKYPDTGIEERRWYLLSERPQLDERIEMNKNKKIRIDYNIDNESRIVDYQEQRRAEEQELREKAIREKDDTERKDQGGE